MFSPVSVCAMVLTGRSDLRLALWAAVGIAAGVFLFIRGFSMLRYKRMIQNTPASKIRSASMGLVELSGMAEGPETIPAGITGEACFYYRAIAWQLKESGRSNEWKKVADESVFVPFFINDATGRMLVDATGADMEVHRNFRDEFNSSFFGSRDMLPENVAKFLARNGVLGGATVRLEERCVKPGYPLFVFGTLAPHSGRPVWVPKPHVSASSVMDVSLNASGRRVPMGNNMTQLLQAIPGIQSAPATPANARAAAPSGAGAVWSSVSMDEVSMARGGTKAAVVEAPASVMAPAERPIVAQEEPAPPPANEFDAAQAAAIGKGAAGAPFMISSESQRELVQALGWKSALCIWGGPILALAGAYYLALFFGVA